ncbi:flotillin-like protein [Acrasis kona]|uniref:Flotillin-like protein n=1 Tax=Acrasis kona TaxID=1008807 RepID=A0AAW2ZBR0_9EUKA
MGQLLTTYEISEPNQFIVKTGLGISSLKVVKATVKWPFQSASRIDVSPHNYEFSLHAMSNEKLQFLLPGVFTIGPNIDHLDSDEGRRNLERYAMFLGGADYTTRDDTIKGIIEGEVRVMSAQMTLEEIFKDRIAFKKGIVDAIQIELDQFGLKVFNANIKELEDAVGSEYFSYIRQKTRAGAENEAKINIAEANQRGTIGAAERTANTRITTALINSKTVVAENEQASIVVDSNTQLEINRIEKETLVKLQRVAQEQQISKKNLELEKEVEEVRQRKRLEELRASRGTDAQIAAEVLSKEADANFYKQVKSADADLYSKQKEAEGILLVANAQKRALEEYSKVFKTDEALLNYLMVDKGLYSELATINSNAIKGLSPKISVWNTGSTNGNETAAGTDPYAAMRNIFQAIPPLMTTVQQQTGITPPAFLGTLPNTSTKKSVAKE